MFKGIITKQFFKMNVFNSLQELESAIEQLALREAKKFQSYHNYMVIEQKKTEARVRTPSRKMIHLPEYWKVSKLFNPFYVLKRKRQISKSIYAKLQDGSYLPNEPYIMPIKKANGKIRSISVYQIPDAAVSGKLYSQLLSKNKHRFSGSSYAYRSDRNVHHAIQDMAHDLGKYPRMFVSEFDFSAFFDSIDHKYLFAQLRENAFMVSESESTLIGAFLKRLPIGVPQGTSISLFLANLVCWKLDRELEREGVRFARYADDTIVWSDSYEKICKSFNVIHEFSVDSGVSINMKKSAGISLLTEEGYSTSSEVFKTKTSVDFLGYCVSYGDVSIKNKTTTRVKRQISYILYRSLLQPFRGGIINVVKCPGNDDVGAFATAIHQVRRFIYGDLSEYKISMYLRGNYKHLKFKGFMSYYPLVKNEQQLRQLDRWLISSILNCLRKREMILSPTFGSQKTRFPYNMGGHDIVAVCKKQKREIEGKGSTYAFVIPSFLRIYKAIKRGLNEEGLSIVDKGNTNYHYE